MIQYIFAVLSYELECSTFTQRFLIQSLNDAEPIPTESVLTLF